MNLAKKLFGRKNDKPVEDSTPDATICIEDKLKELANPKCTKCYGRGHVGRDIINKRWMACPKCLRKYLAKKEQEAQIKFVKDALTTKMAEDKKNAEAAVS